MEFDEIYTEGIVESFIDKLKVAGVEVEEEKIHWRGFGSQGDGACFDFKIDGLEAINFLEKNEFCLYQDIVDVFNAGNIEEISIETVKNSFSNHYCHNKTRTIEVIIIFQEDPVEFNIKNKMLTISTYIKKLEDEVTSWYVGITDEFYSELEESYTSFLEAENEGQEELDDETPFSEKINNLIDPDMNIEKVILKIMKIKVSSNSKEEEAELLLKFIENFNKDYLIIKRY